MTIKSKRALMVTGSLSGLLRPHLAQDAKVDLSGALRGLTDKNLDPKALADKVFGLVQPSLAADAALTVADVRLAIDAAKDLPLGEDEEPDVAEDEADEDVAQDEDPDVAEDEKDDDDKPAMDAAFVRKLTEKARKDALAEGAAIRTAEREVSPVTGELAVAFDSASAVYLAGLEALGVDVAGIPASAYGATFRAVSAARADRPTVAQDANVASSRADFDTRYPNRTKLLKGV